MSINKHQRERRRELAYFRRVKCLRHNCKDCGTWRCQADIRDKYYARGKKIQKVISASIDRLETLFQSVRHPMVDPIPIDPRKQSLRQRIEMSKAAA